MDALNGKAKLGIITNGFTELQAIRLERTGMTQYCLMQVYSSMQWRKWVTRAKSEY